MQPRMKIANLAPELYKAVVALDRAVSATDFDKDLLHLMKIRASQINGCAFCIDLHVKEALAAGLDAQKLQLISAWRESPFFTTSERAMLEWTESVTLISDTGVPDAVYETVKAEFSEVEIAQLTVAIGAINILNRLAVSSRLQHPVSRG